MTLGNRSTFLRYAIAIAIAGAIGCATLLPGAASTYDPQLYGRWEASGTTVTGTGKTKVTQTRTINLTFSANSNIYYEARTTVDGKDTQKAAIAGIYEVPQRGILRVSYDPTLGGDMLVWSYKFVQGALVILDENGQPQIFKKVIPSTPSP